MNVFGGELNIQAMLGPMFPLRSVQGVGVDWTVFRWVGLVWDLSDVRDAANDAQQ